ncbi:MAG: SGNH/GDSL hydrolase family protein [Pyrinomonadaceae bacterium]
MRRDYLMKIGLSTASCLLALLALEIGLRLYGFNPFRDDRGLIFRPSSSPGLKYELTPGAHSNFSGTDIRINSQGFRGPEPSSTRPAQRVLVLGDSIAFGTVLPWEATFSALLQQRLRSEKRDVEVLNFAVGGYDTLQEVALLEARGLKYEPDLVVVSFCLNDISIASASLEHIERIKSQQKSLLRNLRVPQFVFTNIEKIRLKRWLSHMNQPEVFHREYEHQIEAINDNEVELLDLLKNAPRYPSTTWYGDRDRIGRLRFAFRRLAGISRDHGFPVVVMIVPLLLQEGGLYTHLTAHRIVAMEAQRAGFDTIDLAPAFMRAGMGNLKSGFGDIIHPNQRGHAIMADLLADYIASHPRREPPK